MRESTPSLDDVREELRSLGYLKDPILGLLVPRSTLRATLLRVILLTSLRSGIIGATLLAAPLALILARLSRPHVQGSRDLVVLTLYLLPLLGAALALLNLGAELLARFLSFGKGSPGVTEKIAARLGAVLGGATSLYLALIWGQQGGRKVTWLTLALEISLVAAAGWLVGWLMRAGALVIVAAGGGRLERSVRSRAWFHPLVAAFLGALALLGGALFGSSATRSRPMPPLVAAEVPGRLIVIGIDGVDASWLESMTARLELPTLRSLVAKSASWRVRPYPSSLPPEVWTTIATGLPGEVHGVRSFEIRRLPGMSSPILDAGGGSPFTTTVGSSLRLLAFLGPRVTAEPLNSGLRRSPAIWELMNAAGQLTGVINWWGTWPAQSEGGVTISDRAFGSLRYRRMSRRGGGAGSTYIDDGLAYPAPLLRELEAEFPASLDALETRFAATIASRVSGGVLPELHEAFLIDAYHFEIAERVFLERPVRGLFVYVPGQDIALGALRGAASDAGGAPPARGRLDSALHALEAQEILLSETERGIRALIAQMSPPDLLVLVADPGRFFRADEGAAARGGLFVFGSRVRSPGPKGELSTYDITATLLTLAGLAVSEESPGRAPTDLFQIVSGRLGSGSVPTFGDRAERVSSFTEDGEVLDRLRSLGYIE